MKQYHIYGLGAALVDTEIDVKDDELVTMGVEKGYMTLVDEARQHELMRALEGHLVHSSRACGGSAANSVIAASYFGAKTFYSCKVADDDNGRFYLEDLRAAGVDSLFDQELEPGITGKCLVLISPDAERSMNTFLGISGQLSVRELDEQALAASRYLYVEGYLVTSDSGRAAAVRAREIARENGVRTAFSLSDPGMVEHFQDGLREMIGERADLLFCNRAEALGWTGTADLHLAADKLKQSADTFAITLGGDGALVYDGSQYHEIAPVKVKAVDSNGAGDMFAGAFLYAINSGMAYRSAGEFANRAAAAVVSDYGPRLAPANYEALLAAHKDNRPA